MVLLPVSYFPPVWYLGAILLKGGLKINGYERFVKQTIRNRCHILTASGVKPLIIPMDHKGLYGKQIHEVQISYAEPWKRQHLRALDAAYNRSGFYDFYRDDLKLVFDIAGTSLVEFNSLLLKKIISWLRADHLEIEVTLNGMESGSDFENRLKLLCDSGDPQLKNAVKPYLQVFSDRLSFQGGLSVVDLIFNYGPAAIQILHNTSFAEAGRD
jgi:hypothetical protein